MIRPNEHAVAEPGPTVSGAHEVKWTQIVRA